MRAPLRLQGPAVRPARGVVAARLSITCRVGKTKQQVSTAAEPAAGAAEAPTPSGDGPPTAERSRDDLLAELVALQQENVALKARMQEILAKTGAPAAAAARTPAPSDAAAADTVAGGAAAPAAAAGPPPKTFAAELEAGVLWPTAGEQFWTRKPRKGDLLLEDNSPSRRGSAPRDSRVFRVVHMTAEMAPIAKVGGLGDVITGLAKATMDRGHDVRVMLPYYSCLPQSELVGLRHVTDFDCPKGRVWDGVMQQSSLRTSVHEAQVDGVPVWLIAPANRNESSLFSCTRIYGGSYNETEAYLYFCRACLEALRHMGQQPDILHLHEWQCSAAAMLYWEAYNNQGLAGQRVVLTIHNMDNTGECRQEEFGVTGISGELFATIDKALDERTIGHNPERLCLMKGGLVYANAVTTVSPTYAKEAREGGAAGFLRTALNEPHIGDKFSGVLNGIDAEFWCPSRDADLPAVFNSKLPQGKALCKRYLQMGLGLEVNPDKPLVACVTRLVPQKGIHLIRHSVFRTAELGGQFVLLGSGHKEGDFKRLSDEQFRDSKDVKIMLMYSEALAHVIYAAADFVIVPSLFEPCGLTQLIAMRYGAVPIVRRTGGLADTVADVDAAPLGQGNGIVFDGTDEASCGAALERALALFTKNRDAFAAVSAHNMDIDYSWAQPAAAYLGLYERVTAM